METLCLVTKGVFIWRRASPLGRASPLCRDPASQLNYLTTFVFVYMREGRYSPRVYLGKASPPTRANYIYFPTKPGIRYLSKKCWSRQPLSCVRSFDLLALLGGPALLSAFIWKIYSPPRRDLGSQ